MCQDVSGEVHGTDGLKMDEGCRFGGMCPPCVPDAPPVMCQDVSGEVHGTDGLSLNEGCRVGGMWAEGD